MSILSVEKISKSYFGKTVLDELSFRLDAGEHLALTGDNGCGKSTLLQIIAGRVPCDADGGRVVLARSSVLACLDQEFDAANEEALALEDPVLEAGHQAVAHLAKALEKAPQDPELLASYARASSRLESLGAWDFEHQMESVLHGLGLSENALKRPLKSLSGGERMRVALARLLIRRCDLLLLDEPTNHLDADAIEWLEGYLSGFGGACILVSHDRAFLDRCASHTGRLKAGKLHMIPGNYSAYKAYEAAEEERLRSLRKKLSEAVAHETEVVQTMLSHRKMKSYHSREKKLAKLSERLAEVKRQTRSDRPSFSLSIIKAAGRKDPKRLLLAANDLSIHFADSPRPLFAPVDLQILASDKRFILGPNGCGKSSLLKALSGEHPEMLGQVKVSENLQVASLGQVVHFDDPRRSVLDELVTELPSLGPHKALERLASFGFLAQDVHKEIAVLSGGEKARLKLCILLHQSPDLLVLDEPTNHLDIRSKEILEEALARFDGAILAISHDRYFIKALASALWGFIEGEILPFDSYQDYRKALQARKDTAVKSSKPVAPLRSDKRVSQARQRYFTAKEVAYLPALSSFQHFPLNKLGQRRFLAGLAELGRSLEDAIEKKEAELAAYEAQFQAPDPRKIYEAYAACSAELEEGVNLYLKLEELRHNLREER